MLFDFWHVARKTVSIFLEIDGEQRAAAFAFYAFFALFPLLLLVVSVGAMFVDPGEITAAVIKYLESYMPLSEEDSEAVFTIIGGVVDSRKQLGFVAGIGLLWSASRFFHALVRGVNRAWHTVEPNWWKLPLKNIAMLGLFAATLLLGVVAPAIFNMLQHAVQWDLHFLPFVSHVSRFLLPTLILFFGLVVLYQLSPRRRVSFREVWLAAILVTLGLKGLQQLLIFYSYNIWHVNALYGAVGSLIVLLLWIYLCGVLIIAGGCLCSAQAQVLRGVKL